MLVEGLPIPTELVALLESGRWPSGREQERAQNLAPIARPDHFRAFDPHATGLFLYAPPFATVTRLSVHEPFWTWQQAAPDGIDHDLAIPIGDFGLGSDSPIVLDYRGERSRPAVLYLRYDSPPPSPRKEKVFNNRWAPLAPTFGEFAQMAGLQ